MTSKKTPFITKFSKQLEWLEMILILVITFTFFLTSQNMDTSSVTIISFSGLAIIFFLNAFKPIDIEQTEDAKHGFSELLAWVMVPKIAWISSSVSLIGILFYLLHLGNDSHKSMLMIGGSTIGMATLLLGILFISGVRHLSVIMPIFYRAIPLLLIDFYILLK